MWMGRNDAHAEAVGSAVGSQDQALVNVIPLAFRRYAPVENRHSRIPDSTVVGFPVVNFDSNVVRGDRAEMNFRGDLQRFANLDILAISIADLNIKNTHLRPIFAHPRFPFAKLGRGRAVIAREFLVSPGRRNVETLGVLLDHSMRVENRSDAAYRSTHQLEPRQW